MNNNKLIKNTTTYLEESLGISLQISNWDEFEKLPLYLQRSFHAYKTRIAGVECLLIAEKDHKEGDLSLNFLKVPDSLRKYWEGAIILVMPEISVSKWRWLVQGRYSVILPGKQMYLPSLGISFRGIFESKTQHKLALRPSTQVVLFHILLQRELALSSLSELAKEVQVTPMTVSLAADQIDALDIGIRSRKHGRERILVFHKTRKEIWQASQQHLQSPIRSKRKLAIRPENVKLTAAGISALSQLSLIAKPEIAVFAIHSKYFKILGPQEPEFEITGRDSTSVDLELWSYDPSILAKNECVDPLSLYASLRDTKDSRVIAAINSVIEELKW